MTDKTKVAQAALTALSTTNIGSLEADARLLDELLVEYRNCDLMIKAGGIDVARSLLREATKALDERDDEYALAVLEMTTVMLPELEKVADECDRL